MFDGQSVRFLTVDKSHRRGAGHRRRPGDSAEEAWELIQEPLPSVTLVHDEALQHTDGRALASFRADGNISQEGGNAREARDLSEEAADFYIGILSGLQPTEQFQDEFSPVEN